MGGPLVFDIGSLLGNSDAAALVAGSRWLKVLDLLHISAGIYNSTDVP